MILIEKKIDLQKQIPLFSMPKIKVLTVCIVLGLLVFLAACAPQSNTESLSEETQTQDDSSIVQIDWSKDTECGVCHTLEEESLAAIPCESSEQTGSKCALCHINDEAEMEKIHKDASAASTMPSRLKVTEISDEVCLECHYETKNALIAATEGKTIVTDATGLEVNPHNPGAGNAGHEEIQCAKCHNSHKSADIQSVAQTTCKSCHHSDVYECNTCHEA